MVAPEEADLVRKIFERIASGGTLYSEATRLNDLGVLPPSWRYPSAKRPPMKRWSPPTIRTIIRNTTYSGTHRITLYRRGRRTDGSGYCRPKPATACAGAARREPTVFRREEDPQLSPLGTHHLRDLWLQL